MSFAVPAFSDLTKATKTVIYGDTATGEGAFVAGGAARVSSSSRTADGVVLQAALVAAPGAGPTSSLTAVYSPTPSVTLLGIVGSGGALTGAATLSGLLGVPGLQATLTSTPPLPGQRGAASHSLTADYVTGAARLRAVLSPADPSRPLAAPPNAELSATSSAGPFVLGAHAALGGAGCRVASWGAGATWTRMGAEDKGGGGKALAGQQMGVVVAGAGGARSATFSWHQLIGSGATCLAAEYALPLQSKGAGAPQDGFEFALGVSHTVAGTGALLKARATHAGKLGVLHQQALPGVGKLAVSCELDASVPTRLAPLVGFSLSI